MNSASIFAHHDLIASAPSGAVLIVAEPVRGQFILIDAQYRDIPTGTWLRVKHRTGGLWCEVAWDGRIETVVIDSRDFGALEMKPAAP